MTTTAPPPASDAERHAVAYRAAFESRMRRGARRYAVLVAIAVVVLAAVAAVVIRTGEIAHVTSRPAASALPTPVNGTPAASVSERWSTGLQAATGNAVVGGTLIAFDAHRVSGLSVLTGATVWSYTRTDRTACAVAVTEGRVVSFWANSRGCDEVTGLDPQTGTLSWVRTLDADSVTFNGTPHVFVDQYAVYAYNDRAVYSIQASSAPCDPGPGSNCGGNYWDYAAPTGCTVTSVLSGSAGALIGESCPTGDAVVGHQRFLGSSGNSATTGVQWTAAADRWTPLSYDDPAIVLDAGSSALFGLDPASGRHTVTARTALTASAAGVWSQAYGRARVLWTGGPVVAVDETSLAPLWTSAATAPPVSVGTTTLVLRTTSRVTQVDALSGATLQQSTFATPAPDGRAIPVGSGYVLAGTTVSYWA